MTERELIPLNEAGRRLGVSKMTMARLVRDGRFTIYRNPVDKRLKLVDAAEIAEAVRPYQAEEDDTKKAAA